MRKARSLVWTAFSETRAFTRWDAGGVGSDRLWQAVTSAAWGGGQGRFLFTLALAWHLRVVARGDPFGQGPRPCRLDRADGGSAPEPEIDVLSGKTPMNGIGWGWVRVWVGLALLVALPVRGGGASLPPGGLDTSFKMAPAAGVDAHFFRFAPDGRIVVAGAFTNYHGVARRGGRGSTRMARSTARSTSGWLARRACRAIGSTCR